MEPLEDRRLLATVLWDGDAGAVSPGVYDWNDPLNWSEDTLPTAADDVMIDVADAAITVEHAAGDTTVKSLTSAESLTISGGSILRLAGGSTNQVDGLLHLTGSSYLVTQGKNTTGTVGGQWAGKGVTIAAADVTVEAGSAITADGQGYEGHLRTIGYGPGAGGSALYNGGGGSYGGVGGSGYDSAPGATYGLPLTPMDLGSSGGAASDGLHWSSGGAGGGAMRLLVSDTLRLDGQISANGLQGNGWRAGGGSGGSIYVTTGTLTGSGRFQANGGPGMSQYDGGGGGGRIAVYFSDDTGFVDHTLSTASGAGAGAAGTVGFIDESLADGHLHVYTAFAATPSGSLTFGAVTIHDHARLLMPGATNLTADNLTVEPLGLITADGQGYQGHVRTIGNGPGAGGSAIYNGGGGSYGGVGGSGKDSPPGPTYGSALTPMDLGSSGGAASDGLHWSSGGAGGGAMRLVVSGTLTLDGQITANGMQGSGWRAGGGSGGSIRASVGVLNGSGQFRADGGDSKSSYDGGGGGGRICVYVGTNEFGGNISVLGGTGYYSGASGTTCLTEDPTLNPNQPPVADAGGPYTVKVNDTVQLDASNTTDANQCCTTLDYRWDFDGDGVYGETGPAAERGDEVGITPTFDAAGLGLQSSVTVQLRVTDDGGLWDEDDAQIDVVGTPDLVVRSSGINFTPVHPDADEFFTIDAVVTNQGLAAVTGMIDVEFYDFESPGVPLGTAIIAGLLPGESVVVHSPEVSFPESYRVMTVVVDPADMIDEMNEENNEASQVVQIGRASCRERV